MSLARDWCRLAYREDSRDRRRLMRPARLGQHPDEAFGALELFFERRTIHRRVSREDAVLMRVEVIHDIVFSEYGLLKAGGVFGD